LKDKGRFEKKTEATQETGKQKNGGQAGRSLFLKMFRKKNFYVKKY
jgi:hypothetical protein